MSDCARILFLINSSIEAGYSGIVAATNNFSSYSVNADTFEVVATLLRAGAVKKPYRPVARPGMTGGINPFTQMGGMNPFSGQMQMPVQNSKVNRAKPVSQPNIPIEKQTRAVEYVEEEMSGQEGHMDVNENEDWLKPKIFNENDGLV